MIVPTTACIYVLIGYLIGGTIMFAEWENWGYLDSCYFSFTSILKIGFGDFFPGGCQICGQFPRWTLATVSFSQKCIGKTIIFPR